MFQNNIKIALRNLKKHRSYNAINIVGLTISLSAVLLIGLWIQNEYQVNRFHEKGAQIQKLFRSFENENGVLEARDATPFPVAATLKKEFPEVINATAVLSQGNCLIINEKESFFSRGTYANFSLFDIFSLPLIMGSLERAEEQLEGVFISAKLAERNFGSSWKNSSIGQAITIEGGDIGKSTFTVLGVFEDLPQQSDLQFDFVTNIKKFTQEHSRWSRWGSSAFQTYALVHPNTNIEQLSQKIEHLVPENGGNEGLKLHLQAFEDTYLYSTFINAQPTGGRIEYVRIFSIAAAFLLLMACINFINLTTARSTRRAREVGIRKVVGANQWSLVNQFMTETGFIVTLSVVMAVGVVQLILPFANQILDAQLVLPYANPYLWLTLLTMIGLTTLFAGIYPALVLSSFRIINVLKNKLTGRFNSQLFRKGLVVTQFVLSGMLLISALMVQQQINFIKDKNVGLDRNQVIHLNIPEELEEQTLAFKTELLKHSNIESISHISQSPIDVGRSTDDLTWTGKDPNQEVNIQYIYADKDFTEVYKIDMAAGQFFQKTTADFDSTQIILNQTAVNIMGMENPIGSMVRLGEYNFKIIGVMKDFHANSMHENIRPLMVFNATHSADELAIRYTSETTESTLSQLQSTYDKFVNTYPLQYDFLDKNYEKMYRSELLISELAYYFALIAIFISGLGLLGLVTFMAEQKRKEIGIRKVLGASVMSIVGLLSKDFLKLVVLASIIAVPIAWYIMQQWLQNFAYHVEMQWSVVAFAIIIAISVAVLTVSFQGIQAAIVNPIKALKDD